MRDVRSFPGVAPLIPGRRARLLVLALLVTSAVLSGVASDGPEQNGTAAPTLRTAFDQTDPRSIPADESGTDSPSPGAARRPKARTMSMDAPIQGGLSAHQEQAVSARLRAAHKTPATAPHSKYWTPAAGRTAAARAESWLGMPYSWAGGNASGPTAGRCEPGSGGDLDCHVVGFDCSGLVMYAWGPFVSLPHLAEAQRAAGAFRPGLKQLLPGDLVFLSGYLAGGTGHVAVYVGKGDVVEAPQSGSVTRRTKLTELLAEDGIYRGAVRPLTPATPTLDTPRASVPLAGGTVTLHGKDLAGVDALRLGDVVVRKFVRHTDSTLTFRAPKHTRGTVAVTASTSWRATSESIRLAYAPPRPAKPRPTTPAPTPPPAPSSSRPATSTPPPSTSPSTSTSTKAPPTPRPAPSTP